MCLIVNLNFHTPKNGVVKPLKAETNILVYKILEYDEEEKTLSTPYQYLPISFENGQREIVGHGFKKSIKEGDNLNKSRFYVHAGTHAFNTHEAIVKEILNGASMCWNFKSYIAIIPKGSLYYVGVEFDIVADKMIVFETEEDFKKYMKEKEYSEVYNITLAR